MKKFLLLLSLALPLLGWAQIDTVTIQELQTVPAASLANCQDTSAYLGDTVAVRGTVIMNGGLAYTASGRQVWIQSGTGPFSAIGVRAGDPMTSTTKMTDLVAGDSVIFTGVVERFRRETQVNPYSVELLAQGRPVQVLRLDIGELNDDARINQLETGEQWEGQYVEIVDVQVTEVQDPFAGGRQTFWVADANGDEINISDRFPAGRSVNASGGNANNDQGELVMPPTGARFDTIRGVVSHTLPNGCADEGQNPKHGYEIYPFQGSDLVIGASGPLMSNLNRNPIVPTSTEDVTVSVTIQDPDGDVVSALINFAVGLNNQSYQQVALTQNAGTNTYTGQIPSTAYSDGDFVKFYIEATDDSALTTTLPSGAQTDPVLFRVRDGGATIVDIQFNPQGGSSLVENADVTVAGVVTATGQANDLGSVFMQQPGEDAWAGIQLVGSDIADLEQGDSVEVRGTVEENFGFTRLSVIEVTELATGVALPEPVVVDADSFPSYTRYAEQYEGMLVRFENPEDGKGMYVVNDNADGPNNNFAEWVIGNSTLSDQGVRVLSGRGDGSLNFGYINDSTWITEQGAITVPVCVVSVLDTMESLSGIMFYSFGNFKLLPRNTDDMVDFSGANCPDGIATDTTTNVAAPLAQSFRVYPNPAQGQLTVEHQVAAPQGLSLQLLDLTGRQVRALRSAPHGDRSTFNLEGLSSGLYLLRVSNGGEVLLTEKVRVE